MKSSLNPADSLTKPIKASQLSSWHEGPEFLKGFISKEPLDKDFLQNAAQMFKQEEKKKLCLSLHLSTVLSFAESLANRTSSWMRLVRVVAWLRRPLLLRENRSIDLQPSELNDAKLTLFWLAQEIFRPSDQRRLRQRLNMVSSEGKRVELLRIDGRLSKCPWRESAMNPIPLPGSNLIVKLYVTQIHQILGHQGYRVVLSYLHEQGNLYYSRKKIIKVNFFQLHEMQTVSTSFANSTDGTVTKIPIQRSLSTVFFDRT